MNTKEFSYFSLMKGDVFERALALEAIRLGELEYGSAGKYGEAVWPYRAKSVAAATISQIKTTTKTGKPRSITLAEAVTMIEALPGKNFPSFCFEVAEKIKSVRNESIAVPGEAMEALSASARPFHRKPKAQKEVPTGSMAVRRDGDHPVKTREPLGSHQGE